MQRRVAALAITLGVDDDLPASPALAIDRDGGQVLQGIDGLTVPADEKAEVVAADLGHSRVGGLGHRDRGREAHQLDRVFDEDFEILGGGRQSLFRRRSA